MIMFLKTAGWVSLVGCVMFIGTSEIYAASIVVNGSFETPVVSGGFVQRNVGFDFGGSGWAVDTGTIDHINSTWEPAEGNQSIDLNGPTAGSVYQDLSTVIGQSYLIRFAFAGNYAGIEDKRMEVLWGGIQIADLTFTQDGETATDMGWIYMELNAVATGSTTRLRFNSLTGAMSGLQGFTTFYGPALDDVSVTAIDVPVVPEPSTFFLLSSGIVAVAVYRRRHAKRSSN
ncbi:MAG: DUF642 domain-containing protein [Planctomycetaceae bacterium]